MKKDVTLITGPTGSGKTYNAIVNAVHTEFIIAVPCRQLAYEIYISYKLDYVSTGEVNHGDRDGSRKVMVYESIPTDYKGHLIVDEAHLLMDESRGRDLLESCLKASSLTLMTATDSMSKKVKKALKINNVIRLESNDVVEKKEVSVDTFIERVSNGVPSILFTKYAPDEGYVQHMSELTGLPVSKIGLMSANILSADRLSTQLKFLSGDITLVISSNVLAQGVNFPAMNVLIEFNEWDDPEIVEQKIGRIGRPGFDLGVSNATYALQAVREKVKRKKGIPEKNDGISEIMKFHGVPRNIKVTSIPGDFWKK